MPARPWLQHYDYWTPTTLRYPQRPLSDILDTTAIEIPDHPATWFLGATMSYREIKSRSDALAVALAARGIGKRDRVGVMLPNCPQYIIAAFAILRLGAIVVNVNPSYTAPEILNTVTDSGMRGIVTLDRLAPLVQSIASATTIEFVVTTPLTEFAATPQTAHDSAGTITLASMIEGSAGRRVPPVPIASDDIAVLQYTGGTTGTPKAAMLTHGNIFANVIQSETWYYRTLIRGEARYLMVIPYFHIYAFTVGMMCGTWIGAMQILIPKYDVEQVLTAIRDLKPTYFPAVPTIFVSMLAHPRIDDFGLDRVARFNSGGAPCPIKVLEQFEARTGRPLNQGYGLSETSPVTHTQPQLGAPRLGTIGLPLPGTDIKVVDVESGERELPCGEAGELCISGPQVMKGYWNKPEESAAVLRRDAEGRVWFHTGDIATIDVDGFTTIVQRKKDMIIVDGFNVYPSDVESVLYAHPAVRLAAVIGVPHDYHGEVVKACIVLRDGMAASAEDIKAHCARSLTEYKRPRQIELRDSLPMSAVGKILYRVLREEPHTT